jgi:hypothetical protein
MIPLTIAGEDQQETREKLLTPSFRNLVRLVNGARQNIGSAACTCHGAHF